MGRSGAESSYELQRADVFRRLVHDERFGLLDAEHWLRAWEAKAEEIGRPRDSTGYWEEAWRWIMGQRALERDNAD